MIYFIQSADGPVKIGISENPRARMEELQSACPRRLKIIGCEYGEHFREAVLHRKFAHLRTDGGSEWFEASDELLQYISERTEHNLPNDLRSVWREDPERGINAIVSFWSSQEKLDDWWDEKWGCQLALWEDVRPIWMRSHDGDYRRSYAKADDGGD